MKQATFEVMLRILCGRLSDLHEVYWTVTELPALYETSVSEYPNTPDVALLEWIVKYKVLKSIQIADGVTLNIAKDGKRCALFCRHYQAIVLEKLNEQNPEIELGEALVKIWQDKIEKHGVDEAKAKMQKHFAGRQTDAFKTQMNESYKAAIA